MRLRVDCRPVDSCVYLLFCRIASSELEFERWLKVDVISVVKHDLPTNSDDSLVIFPQHSGDFN